MIKWFDADRFLPGKLVEKVLARVVVNDSIDSYYHIGEYIDDEWLDEGDPLEDSESRVTHWAFIEEPI